MGPRQTFMDSHIGACFLEYIFFFIIYKMVMVLMMISVEAVSLYE